MQRLKWTAGMVAKELLMVVKNYPGSFISGPGDKHHFSVPTYCGRTMKRH